jgi:energy-coupling factor transporter transmembrane protein EcfT
MARWSFGLRQLFLWTAAIALGLVALRSATMNWVAGMFGLALALLVASVLLVVFRRGPQRAYWIGFATVGWLYVLLLATSWMPVDPNSENDTPFRPYNLATQRLSNAAYHWLYDDAFEKYHAMGYAGGSMGGRGYSGGPRVYPILGMMPGGMGAAPPPGPPPGPNETDFVNVAHALWTLLFAVIGGCVAYWLYMTGPGRKGAPAPT